MTVQSDYLLNEAELGKLTDSKKPIYIYNWLRNLSKLLLKTQKVFELLFDNVDFKFVSF